MKQGSWEQMITSKAITCSLQNLIKLLVDKNYKVLQTNGILGDLEASDIQEVIDSYPGALTNPPDKEYYNFHRYDYGDNGCYVEFNLFFDNKKSDLSLCLEMSQKEKNIRG